jgi:hypothetical protein
MTDPLSPAVRELLAERIETFEHLEVALLFAREPLRPRTVTSIIAELRMPDGAITEALEHLANRKVLDRTDSGGATVFSCRRELVSSLTDLATAYERDRSSIMRVMSAHALERVRTAALRAFTSAFLLGKKPHG